MSVFTDKLDFLLAKNCIRRADLSRATLIPESSIRNWYIGKTPSVEIALKIAKYFGVSVEWLFSDAGMQEINKINELKKQPELNLDEVQPLTFQENKLIECFRALDNRDKNTILLMAQTLEKLE
ncbi:MAG: helix-turn-helix domain-containing protein [archaeon]|nr:helix-turn-helix domain-containing protein [archaeon]